MSVDPFFYPQVPLPNGEIKGKYLEPSSESVYLIFFTTLLHSLNESLSSF
jgi:hypothetical protein